MASELLRIGYTSNAGDVYAIDLTRFGDEELPRQYVDSASVEFSTLGNAYGVGPIGSQKVIWTVQTYLYDFATTNAQKNGAAYSEVRVIDEMFKAWDLDRGNGLAARIVIEDEILTFGSTINANAWFTSTPTYQIAGSYGNNLLSVIFGLTEV